MAKSSASKPALPAVTQAHLHAASLSAWLVDQRPEVKIGSRTLSFKTHPYLADFLDDDHPDQVIIKGAQLGWTTAAQLKVLCELYRMDLRGALYLFPRQDDIADFSRARLGPLIDANPVFRGMVQDTDAMSLKRVGKGNLYLRHIGGDESVVKSIDCDRVIYDERDEMDDDKVELADHRLDSSDCGIRIEFSTPTIPGFGVSRSYDASDQCVWQIKCRHPGCGEWTSLELTWPDCIRRMPDGSVIRACRRCGKEIHVNDGDWVATYPERTKRRGRWVSQLCGSAPRQQPAFILDAYETATREGKLREFHNSVLGMPYAEIDDVLTPALCLSFCEPAVPRGTSSRGPCAMGVDVGAQTFHWTAAEKRSDRLAQVVGFGIARSEDEMLSILQAHNTACAVFDGMAETRSVRSLKAKHASVWENHYVGQKRETQWDYRERRVSCHRTTSLDESHQALLQGRIRLPRADEQHHKVLSPQLCNLARQIHVKDKRVTERPEAVWVCVGAKNDHFRHAVNYLSLALEQVGLAQPRESRESSWVGKSRAPARDFMAR